MEVITNVNQLEKYRGKIVFVEMGWNPYLTRFYLIKDRPPIYWSDGSFGYAASCSVGADGVHGDHALCDRDLERGTLKIREATAFEKEAVVISYT